MPGVPQTNNSVMTALVTDDEVKFDKLAALYDLKSYKYDQYESMIADNVCDAVYIATPNFLHKEFAIKALEKGVHVLLEKPMATSVEECEEICAAATKGNAKLMIAYRLHFEECTLKVIDRVRSGDFGEPVAFTSVNTQPLDKDNHRAKHGFDEGPMADVGVYCINAARNLFAAEPIEITAVGVKTRPELKMQHDTISVIMKFPDNKIASFNTSYALALENYYTIVGTSGSVTVKPCFGYGPGTEISYEATIDGKKESKSFSEVDQFAGETEYFSDCILNNVDPEPNGEEGLMDVRILVAVKKALETGQTQILDPKRREKRTTLDQVKKKKQATPPKEYIGREAEDPAKPLHEQ